MDINYKSPSESHLTISQLMLPSHANFQGKIHGGHILNLMDQIAYACACKHSGNYCVTASVNKVDFLNPIEVGDIVTMKAAVNYTGRTSMVVGLRVESQNVRSGEIKHCNSSYFTMVAKDEKGNNAAVPGLKLETIEDARRFARSIVRQEQGRMRSNRFSPAEFVIDEYMDSIRSANAQITFDI